MIVKSMISLLLAAMFLLTPASADIFDDMNARVSEYNDNIDQIPGTLKSILSDQNVIIIVYMNEAELASESESENESIELAGPAFTLDLSEGPFVTGGAIMKIIAITDSDASVIKFGRWSNLDEEHNWDGEEFAETIVVTTNENTARAIMDSESPGETFMDAYESDLIIIEASERASMTTKISLALMPWVMKLYTIIG